MRRSVLIGLLTWALAGATSHAEVRLVSAHGFSWETGGFVPSQVGDTLSIVAVANDVHAMLGIDPDAGEVTVHLAGGISSGVVDLGGGYWIVTYTSATLEFWQDPSSHHDFGVHPPNDTVPASFVDGTLLLRGQLGPLFWFVDTNLGFGLFDAEELNFTAGSALETVQQILDDHYDTYFGFEGAYTVTGSVSAGYDTPMHAVFTLRIPGVAVEELPWTKVKMLYR